MRNPFAKDGGFQDWLGAQWADSLRLALENMSATAIPVEPGVPLESGANPGSDWLWLQQALTQAPQCPLWVGAPAVTWRRIAERILEAAGLESVDEEEIRRTYIEVVQHSFNALASAVSGVLGHDLTCGSSNLTPLAPPLPWLQFTLGADLGTPIFLAFAPTLRESLAALATPPRTEGSLAQLPAPPPKAPGVASKIEVLYEVELPVSISFGHAQLPLRDVLKLATGSIVELNRTVSEPVDIVVNNCVIARGEVVVVDGNYGVKILEIVNHSERLRSLR